MRPERHSAGYTLIEVLVAFLILALALAVLMRIFAGGVRNVAVASDYARAVLIAESRLAEAGIDGTLLPGDISGIEEDRYTWTRSVEPYVLDSGTAQAQPKVAAWYVTVSVAWPHETGRRSIDLSTVRLLENRGRGS